MLSLLEIYKKILAGKNGVQSIDLCFSDKRNNFTINIEFSPVLARAIVPGKFCVRARLTLGLWPVSLKCLVRAIVPGKIL